MDRGIFWTLLQPWVVITITAVIAAGSVAVAFIMTNSKPAGAYVTPTQGTIVQTVDTTGIVAAATSLDLSFQTAGQIAYAGPAVGTHVSADTTLSTLSAGSLKAQLAQAQAGLAAAKAQLATLQAGATPETVAVSQTSVTNAQNALTQAKQSVIAAATNAYVESDDAIHNRVDQFFTNPRTNNPTLALSSSDSQGVINVQNGRITMEKMLTAWQSSLAALPSDPNQVDVQTLESQTAANLLQVGQYLDEIAEVLSDGVPTQSVSAAQISTYQSSTATARADITAAVNALNTAETAEENAASALASAQAELSLTQAPPTQDALDTQEAAVQSAQANVDLAEAQLSNAVITAPISGTITVNNAKVGETAQSGTPLISMISDSKFEMDTYVSEADLAKLKVGDAASVTLDAYQNSAPFAAQVSAIDPAATVQNGVSSYKVTLQFDQNDSRIQSGMTGSASITTATEQNALSIPTSAIITEGTNTFVFVKSPGGDREVPVKTGITSTSGMTEILSGLTLADDVRTFGGQ
ncbi:MAG TPA: efflux RND transporter periplasmic adaptor subunit [Candidatus Paceibacterota bacterium]|nr:efflux RND transporter periplasmic adaptor subunit [Candidatus Paceibacterota bacterium]